jgi:hypothetical protein
MQPFEHAAAPRLAIPVSPYALSLFFLKVGELVYLASTKSRKVAI